MGGREINVDSQGVRRAANGKLADAADGTGRIAERLEGLGGGAGLGGSGAAASFGAREAATQRVFGGALRQAHQELSRDRDSLVRGMDSYDRADDESATASESVASALPSLGRSGVERAYDRGRGEAGEALSNQIGAEDEIEMTEQQEDLAAEATAENGGTGVEEAAFTPGDPPAGPDATDTGTEAEGPADLQR